MGSGPQEGGFSQYGRGEVRRPVLGEWFEHGEGPPPRETYEKDRRSNLDCPSSHAKRGESFEGPRWHAGAVGAGQNLDCPT